MDFDFTGVDECTHLLRTILSFFSLLEVPYFLFVSHEVSPCFLPVYLLKQKTSSTNPRGHVVDSCCIDAVAEREHDLILT